MSNSSSTDLRIYSNSSTESPPESSIINSDKSRISKKKPKKKRKGRKKKLHDDVQKTEEYKEDANNNAPREDVNEINNDLKPVLPIIDPPTTEASKKLKKRKKGKKKKNNQNVNDKNDGPIDTLTTNLQTPEALPYNFDLLSYNSFSTAEAQAFQKNKHSYQGELLTHNYYTLPNNVKKFWDRRYALFPKFDEGIYLSSELWYSVTPDAIARYTANLFRKLLPNATSCVDLCCGGGGNTIQFAKLFDHVGAIDINPINLYCTEHNCEIYNVTDNVWLLEGDWNELSAPQADGSINYDWIPENIRRDAEEEKPIDFIFSSPPWGGTNYERDGFDLESMEPFPITRMLQQLRQYTNNIGLFLPKLSNLDQLDTATRNVFGEDSRCRVVHIRSYGRIFAILALIGEELIDNFDEQGRIKKLERERRMMEREQEQEEYEDEDEYDNSDQEQEQYSEDHGNSYDEGNQELYDDDENNASEDVYDEGDYEDNDSEQEKYDRDDNSRTHSDESRDYKNSSDISVSTPEISPEEANALMNVLPGENVSDDEIPDFEDI